MKRISENRIKEIVERIVGDKICYHGFEYYQDRIHIYDSTSTLIAIISYTIKESTMFWEFGIMESHGLFGSFNVQDNGELNISEYL